MCYHSNTIKCDETNILPTDYKYMNIYFLNPLFAIHCWRRPSTASFKCQRFRLRSVLKTIVMALFNEATDENGSFLLLKTILFNVDHSQKSLGVKSGEYGGHGSLKCFPITLSPKMSDIILLVVNAVCGAVTSSRKYDLDTFRQDLSCWANQVMQSWWASLLTGIWERFLWKKILPN